MKKQTLIRLSGAKIDTLKSSIKSLLPSSKIYLFGSRTDPEKKGGDIDILILADRELDFRDKSKIERTFFSRFGEQKLDLVSFTFDSMNPFKNIALDRAVEL